MNNFFRSISKLVSLISIKNYNNTSMKTICDWNNCNKEGKYKAPVEKDNSKNFRYLCFEHIKEFNKNWNYFANMNDEQITNLLKMT